MGGLHCLRHADGQGCQTVGQNIADGIAECEACCPDIGIVGIEDLFFAIEAVERLGEIQQIEDQYRAVHLFGSAADGGTISQSGDCEGFFFGAVQQAPIDRTIGQSPFCGFPGDGIDPGADILDIRTGITFEAEGCLRIEKDRCFSD